MKRLILAIVVLLVSVVARADEIVLFNAVATDATSAIYDLSGYNKISVQVSSVAGSTAVFTLSCRNTASDPWTTAFSVSNPGTAEPPYVGPGACFCRASISGWTSGTLSASMKRTK